MDMKKQRVMLFLGVLLMVFSGAVAALADDGQPRLGLSLEVFEASPLLLQHLKLSEGEGVMIRNVAVGGDLEAAGLSQGDILLAIDGHKMSRPQDVAAYISNLPKGTKVTLDVIQKGDHHQVHAVLDSLPDDVTWKYVEPAVRRGRRNSPLTMGPGAALPQAGQPASPGNLSGSQKMMFRFAVQTDRGLVMSAVTITGNPEDPESEIEISVGDKKYVSKIGEIEALPEDARQAAEQALQQSAQFSFSFGFDAGGSLIEEMMRRQREGMGAFEQMFFGPQLFQMLPFFQENEERQPEKSPLKIEDPLRS